MAVYVSNIVIEQGFSFESTFQLEDTRTGNFLDLSGYDIKSQIRKSYYSKNYISFASTITDIELGEITISLEPNQTILLKPGRYVYDIKLFNQSGQYKAIEGSALVRAGVTT